MNNVAELDLHCSLHTPCDDLGMQRVAESSAHSQFIVTCVIDEYFAAILYDGCFIYLL